MRSVVENPQGSIDFRSERSFPGRAIERPDRVLEDESKAPGSCGRVLEDEENRFGSFRVVLGDEGIAADLASRVLGRRKKSSPQLSRRRRG
jgi:hypothetical protein